MKSLLFAIGLLLLLSTVLIRYRERYKYPSLIVTFFDVGQGDSTLIQIPGGKTILIDTGGGFGKFDVGTRVLFPELTRLGILHLDAVILTHEDWDHAYGIFGLLPWISIERVWIPEASKAATSNGIFPVLKKLAQARGIRIQTVTFLKWAPASDVSVEIRAPQTASPKRNNHSLVTLIEFAGCRFLFTADIEKPAEQSLQTTLPPVHFLKVAHHGSRSSTTKAFLEKVRPKWAILSSGMGNAYGHPHTEVVTRLVQFGVRVHRTDLHGFVQMVVQRDGSFECRDGHGGCGTFRCNP